METLGQLKTKINGNSMSVEVFNRTYLYDGFLPDKIIVGGENVLAAPIRLVCAFNGIEEHLRDYSAYVSKNTSDELLWMVQCAAGNMKINARISVYPDGLVWADFMIIPESDCGIPQCTTEETVPTLNSMILEIPLKKETAELYHYWPVSDSGVLQTGSISNSGQVSDTDMHICFKPSLWLGKEERGLTFYAETDENWQPQNENNVLEILHRDGCILLRVHILDSLPKTWEQGASQWVKQTPPIKFSFGLQATPVKEFEKQQNFERVYHTGLYALPKTVSELDVYFSDLASKSVKWHTLHEDWSIIQNYGLAENEDFFKKLVSIAHAHGIKIMVYFGYECSTMVPDFFENSENYLIKTTEGYLTGGWQRLPHQHDYMVCYKSNYGKVMRSRVEYVMDEYGVDGIYTDGMFMPVACANANHGCGYIGFDGNRHLTYPLRALREHVKLLRKIVHDRGGVIETHQSSCCVPMILGYADSYFDGEHIIAKYNENLNTFFDTASVRAEFVGKNYGVPCQFLCASQNFDEGSGVMLLYGVPSKAYGSKSSLEISARNWAIYDDFGAIDELFVPYWDNCPVKTDTDGVLVSAWVKSNELLAVAVNLTGKTAHVSFVCDKQIQEIRDEIRKTVIDKKGLIEIPPSAPQFFRMCF